jgi:chitin synthase
MVVCSVVCALAAASQGGGTVMLLSLLVTYGGECDVYRIKSTHGEEKISTVYAFGSILAFDPWHMLTSFAQYLLLSPTYVNILNMYVYRLHFMSLTDRTPDTLSPTSTMRVFFLASLLLITQLFPQISWGTKQDTAVETDLGAVIQDSHAEVDVEMLTEPADVNGIYEEALFNLKNRKPPLVKGNGILSIAEKEQNAKDYYANVRTNVNRIQ